MPKRNLIGISNEAHAALKKVQKRTGRTAKDLVSTAILKLVSWDETTQSMVWDTLPDSLVNDPHFWEHARQQLIAGIDRCREKYGRVK
jgi:hypothetical protein